MKRFTIRNSDGSVSQPTDLKWAEALEKLAEYEDAEENGTLIRFSKEINLSLPVHQKFMIEICDGYTKLESIDLLDFTSTISIEMEFEGQKYGEHINFYDTPVISMQDKGLVSGNLIQLMCLTLERLYAEKNKTTQ